MQILCETKSGYAPVIVRISDIARKAERFEAAIVASMHTGQLDYRIEIDNTKFKSLHNELHSISRSQSDH